MEKVKEKFAEGINFKKLFWVFLIGSIIGAYYEEFFTIIWNYIDYHEFIWAPRRGVIWGPFSPIYGFGAVFMTWALIGHNDKWYISFIKTALIGGVFEFLVSYFQEMFLHTVAWDYSDFFLNIGGRTTVPYMIIWGILGVLFVKFVYPLMSKFIESLPVSFGNKLTWILVVLLSLDIIISWGAIIRQSLRKSGMEPLTIVGSTYDKYFDDEYLHIHFPNTFDR